MNVMKKFYIKTLTPVHIGCDEVYEPLNFVVDEGRRKLIVFDSLDFFKGLEPNDQVKLSEISKKGTVRSLLELMKFMRGKKVNGREINVSSGFIGNYARSVGMGTEDEKKIQEELNRFEIKRTAYNPYTNLPYLPGSSVKGSLRTAYLNLMAKRKPGVKSNPKEKGANKKLEQDLLDYRSIDTDPFRLLKVSDFMPVEVSTRIIYAVNEKKSGGKEARGPSQILEVIDPGSWFVGTISVDEERSNHPHIRLQLTLDEVLRSLNFYVKEKNREEKELEHAGINKCALDVDGGRLIRLGHHSGAESVTIEGHRSILIRGKKSYYSNKATTFWLASDFNKGYDKSKILPFGWALLVEATDEIERKINETRRSSSSEEIKVEPLAEAVVEKPSTMTPTVEEWQLASITWSPGNQEITATFEGKKAVTKNKDMVPEGMRKELFEKRKGIHAKVLVEKVYNRYTVIKIMSN